jgi:hypothetical protein
VIKPAIAPRPKVTELLSFPEAGLIYPNATPWSEEYDVKRTAELAPCFMICHVQLWGRGAFVGHSPLAINLDRFHLVPPDDIFQLFRLPSSYTWESVARRPGSISFWHQLDRAALLT